MECVEIGSTLHHHITFLVALSAVVLAMLCMRVNVFVCCGRQSCGVWRTNRGPSLKATSPTQSSQSSCQLPIVGSISLTITVSSFQPTNLSYTNGLVGLISLTITISLVGCLAGKHTFFWRGKALSLRDAVDANAIEASGFLDDPEVQEALLPLLPEGNQTAEELRETVSIVAVLFQSTPLPRSTCWGRGKRCCAMVDSYWNWKPRYAGVLLFLVKRRSANSSASLRMRVNWHYPVLCPPYLSSLALLDLSLSLSLLDLAAPCRRIRSSPETWNTTTVSAGTYGLVFRKM